MRDHDSFVVSEEQVVRIFSEIAQSYERFNHVASFGLDRYWLRSLVRLSPICARSHVLDAAGGTGEVSFAICRSKPPRHIMLTDLSPNMLLMAQKRIERGDSKGIPVETRIVDAQSMPFCDDSFDVVTMAYGIRNMPDRQRALKEMHRVLKPGGSACILEFSSPVLGIMRPFHRMYLKRIVPIIGKLCTGHKDEFKYLADSILAFPDQESFAQMLLEAGFSQVSHSNRSMGIVSIHIAVK